MPFLVFYTQAAFLAAAYGGLRPDSSPVWQSSALGQTAVFHMTNAPFPHASRADGFKTAERTFPRDPHYTDDRVAIFIPRHFQPGKRVDLLLYFHGHYNHIAKCIEQFKLREQVAAAGQNVILVCPQGPRDAGDSGGGKLEQPGGLHRLVDEVLDTLAAERKLPHRRLGRVLLAGHSGAYRVIAFGLSVGGLDGNITDVGLLDASYGQLDAFTDWVSGHKKGRLFSIFTDHLADENVALMTRLRKLGQGYELLDAQDAADDTLKSNRILFLHASKLTHDGTVVWLERWLKATARTTPLSP